MLRNAKTGFLRCIGYPGFIKDRIKLGSPIKNSGEVLSKLQDIGYEATSLSTYDFSTLYTTIPHNLIKEKLLYLIERTFY